MNIKNILLASAVIVAAPTVVSAQEFDVSFNVGVTNDYVWRGVSQSAEDPAVQAGVDFSSGIFYAGTWASNVDFGSDADLEWDLYAGVTPSLGPITFDFGVLAYMYPKETDLNIIEGLAAATYEAPGGFSLTGSLYYSPEVGTDGPSSTYAELSAGVPLPATVGPFSLGLGASVGNYSFDDDSLEDYTNYRLSFTGETESGWGFDLGYSDTDLHGVDEAEGRVALLLTKSF